jgi:hypothetical protein
LSDRKDVRTSTGRTDEDHAHAIDGRLGASVRLAILALELVDSGLQRVDVAPELLDDLFGRHVAGCVYGALTEATMIGVEVRVWRMSRVGGEVLTGSWCCARLGSRIECGCVGRPPRKRRELLPAKPDAFRPAERMKLGTQSATK